MELNGLSEFTKDLEILRDLQRKMISILSSIKLPNSSTTNQINDLFNFLEKISISNHFSLYEAFLHIFVHLSIYFDFKETKDENIQSKRQEIFFMILKELILKHSLKTSIHSTTLFLIFLANKHFLLFLLEEGIFDISFLIHEISLFNDQNLFIFFIPEIKKFNLQSYEDFMGHFNLTEEEVIDFSFELKEKSPEEDLTKKEDRDDNNNKEKENQFLIEIRRKIHSEEEIAKIIRSDDINQFIDFVSRKGNFDLNSRIKPTFFENNIDLSSESQGINLLDYSVIFGSINIFRYLLLNKVKFSKESFKYCIIGNNYEILHIFEEDEQLEFDKKCYLKCFEYYHPELIEYFSNFNNSNNANFSEKINDLTISSIIQIFNETTNIEILCEIILKKEISHVSENDQYQYFSSSNYLISTFDLNQIHSNLLNLQFSFSFLYSFLLQQTKIDVNLKNNIFIFQFMIHFYF
ncbi:hypothetical protein TRFO_19715 [Tritrichomonas foetus]|uniref:DUF3447 domain-containing protein n=1 Tax=Tritrichomonas foetus TaxID=1144522 RepID=A0A1J4KM82_9EUKA|nr:hypothetical protein TRFO_19715 [Tritrichomonas foetus]|eukprot:OHT10908.1 hypothetical protein TRFO_19715 [Tritrichomonas foetus]